MNLATALVTGAAGGIGFELAKLLCLDGHTVILVDIDAGRLAAAQEALTPLAKAPLHTIAQDLTEAQAAQRIYETLEAQGLQVDILINNAGLGDFGFFAEAHWPKQETIIKLNILALTHLTHLLIPGMIARKQGRIMNVASMAAFQPSPLMSIYFASKAFVLSFSEALSSELRPHGISVTVLCPGTTRTGFQAAVGAGTPEMSDKKWAYASAEEVALYGYRAMMRGTTIAIHGTVNKLLVFLQRLLPRKVVVKMVRRGQERNRRALVRAQQAKA
ncbi:SDR family NAD(P)-dependent oxidoreductase [Eisenibacter elegans]|jgi:short-subunit dehydrogenase|uniref:SDR family NAD(P)-dependent oxidoreductase n=1 Tax=Eisenibacter elegans TaxID=997 RepID=UPI0004154D62|nr:SDR family oxidoreductase [Eisenibacter elegans]